MPKPLDLPPVWLLMGLGLAWLFDRLVPLGIFGAPGRAAGQALVAIGIVLMLAAVVQMVQSRTTFIPRQDPAALVTGGVFAFSRNPIYLGDALVLAGAILWWDVPLALPLVLVFIAVIQHRFILDEEARLERAFGPAYATWAARVPRWIGLPGRRSGL